MTLENFYGPNHDSPNFYNTDTQIITVFENDQVIVCGDWNFIINPELGSDNNINVNS